MRYRKPIVVSLLTVAALAAAAAIAAQRMPAGTMLAVHWNAAGQADGWASISVAVMLPVAMAAGVSLLMAVVPSLPSFREKADANDTVYRTVWYGVLALAVVTQLMIAGPAFNLAIFGDAAVAAVGVLFLILGNILPKSRPNRVVGIRTPWTLSGPDVWIATHRVGSGVMIAGGILLIVLPLMPIAPPAKAMAVILVALAVATIPILYSYHHRKHG